MRIHWTELGAAVALAGAGCAAVYAALQYSMKRAMVDEQLSTDRQIAALATEVKALHAQVAQLSRLAAERAGEARMVESAENADANDPMKPETLAVITAAATAFVGKAARIRSARLVPADEAVSAWTQQGRMTVQTSHNLRSRG